MKDEDLDEHREGKSLDFKERDNCKLNIFLLYFLTTK